MLVAGASLPPSPGAHHEKRRGTKLQSTAGEAQRVGPPLDCRGRRRNTPAPSPAPTNSGNASPVPPPPLSCRIWSRDVAVADPKLGVEEGVGGLEEDAAEFCIGDDGGCLPVAHATAPAAGCSTLCLRRPPPSPVGGWCATPMAGRRRAAKEDAGGPGGEVSPAAGLWRRATDDQILVDRCVSMPREKIGKRGRKRKIKKNGGSDILERDLKGLQK